MAPATVIVCRLVAQAEAETRIVLENLQKQFTPKSVETEEEVSASPSSPLCRRLNH